MTAFASLSNHAAVNLLKLAFIRYKYVKCMLSNSLLPFSTRLYAGACQKRQTAITEVGVVYLDLYK